MVGKLDIYRAGALFATVDIDESTVFTEKLPGTDFIACPIKTLRAVDFQEGDYITHKGTNYKINIIPEFGKASSTKAKSYKINFEAPFYDLIDIFIENSQGAHTFPYYANARDHAQMVIDNANLEGSGYTLGAIEDTEAVLINYDWSYARASLDDIAKATGLEWKFNGKELTMVKAIGRDTSLVFQYGRGKGLHEITRAPDNNKAIVNKVYGVGGTKNITAAYRNGTESNLVFEERFVTTPGVLARTERPKHGKYENLEIYPRFEGTVTATTLIRDEANVITGATITDTSINFDLNLHLQEGVKAKVSFRTGPLAGVEGGFEIENINYATKTVTIIVNTDANNYTLPNELNFPEVGHKFTFLDVIMPPEYVVAAELELKTASELYRDQNKAQRLNYSVVLDEKQLRDNLIQLHAGDRANMIDVDLNVDEILRFTEISYPLVNEYKVTGTIGNEITYSREVKLYADVLNNTQQMASIDRRGQEIAKRGAQNLRVLAESIFDVEGNFDSAKFNVGVLSALLGIFGIKSANFLLNRVFITANFGSDPNAVNISTGELFHLEYSNPGDQNIWQMQAVTQSGLVPGQEYYVYSKLSKSSQVGTFLITTDQIRPDDIPGFYTVRTGIIYPQINGWRDVDFTYGITTVNGRQIKTGIIQGNTGALIINLDTGEIFGKVTFRSSNGSVKDVADLQDQVDKLPIQGRNYYGRTSPFNSMGPGSTVASQTSNGFILRGVVNNDGFARVSNVITSNGDWTISFDVFVDGVAWSGTFIDVCDGAAVYLPGIPLNGTVGSPKHFEFTVNVQNYTQELYNFIDFNALSSQNYYFSNFKVEKGTKATPWTPAPEDTQADLDLAIAQASEALAEIDNISNDGILDVSEKTSLYQRYLTILAEKDILVASAAPFGVSTGDYVGNWNVVRSQLETNWLQNLAIATPVDRIYFDTVFTNYYNSKVNLQKSITDAANGKINNIQTGGRNYIKNSNFARGLEGWYTNGGTATPTVKDGKTCLYIESLAAYNGIFGGNAGQSLIAGETYTISFDIQAAFYQTSETFIVGYNQAGSKAIAVPNEPQWRRVSFQIVSGFTGQDSLIFYGFANTQTFYLTNLQVERGTLVTDWKPAPEDVSQYADQVAYNALVQANATAESIATSKANAAQAAAQYNAANDAQAKADAAYNASVAASNAYSNNIGSVAAADASNKATAAYNNAQAAANAQYNALTGTLKTLAFRDIQTAGSNGVIVVDGGNFIAFSVDAAYIRANVINAGYINTLSLDAVTGTIGGWVINSEGLYSPQPPSTPIDQYQSIKLRAAGNAIVMERGVSGKIWDVGSQSWINSGGYVIQSSYMSPNGLVVRSSGQNAGVNGVISAVHIEGSGSATHGLYVGISDTPGNYAAWLNGNVKMSGSQTLKATSVGLPYYVNEFDYQIFVSAGSGAVNLPSVSEGRTIEVINLLSGAISISYGSSNIISSLVTANAVPVSSFSLPGFASVKMMATGSYWFAVGR